MSPLSETRPNSAWRSHSESHLLLPRNLWSGTCLEATERWNAFQLRAENSPRSANRTAWEVYASSLLGFALFEKRCMSREDAKSRREGLRISFASSRLRVRQSAILALTKCSSLRRVASSWIHRFTNQPAVEILPAALQKSDMLNPAIRQASPADGCPRTRQASIFVDLFNAPS